MSNDVIYESAKDTAKKIRTRLRKEFPDFGARHFSVTSKTYAGGSSVSVEWKDYPERDVVDKIIKQYQSASFDGMQDMESIHGYKDPEDGKHYSGAKYIFSRYEKTDEDKKESRKPDPIVVDASKSAKKEEDKSKNITEKTLDDVVGLNKGAATEVKYERKDKLALDVLIGLLSGVVRLNFIKADGTERFMTATRSVKLVEDAELKGELVRLNDEAEIKIEVSKGTISVIDLEKNATRKFVLERVKYYQIDGKEPVKVLWEDKNEDDSSKHFDPTKLGTAKMIDILNKKVVRLVFEKKDGTSRPMIATREPELVELYTKAEEGVNRKPAPTKDNTEEAVKRQIERDYVSVFDLVEGEFRSFKPSKVKRYDDDLGISSWIEFTIKNDAWYDIARNGADVTQYYVEGKRTAKSIGTSLAERERYETKQRGYIEDRKLHFKMLEERKKYAESVRKEASIKAKRRQVIKEIANREAKQHVSKGITQKDEKIYRELVRVPDKLANDIAFNNMDNEVTQVKNFDKLLLVAIQVRQDVFYLHPLFIVNAYSGRVFADNTADKVFSEIGKVFDSDADWGSEDILKPLAEKLQTSRKKKSMFNQDEGTVLRMRRINTLAEQHKQAYRGYGLELTKRQSPDKSTEMLGILYKGRHYLLHPDVVIQVEGGKGKVVFKVQRTTSRVTEFNQFFNGWIKGLDNERDRKVITQLAKMILHGLDLRKTVKEVS